MVRYLMVTRKKTLRRSRLEKGVFLSEVLAAIGLSEDNNAGGVQTFCFGGGAGGDTKTEGSTEMG